MRFLTTNDQKLTIQQNIDLLDYFDKNLVMGIECERNIPIDGASLAAHLKTRRFGVSSSKGDDMLKVYKGACSNIYNVAFVTHDSSVNNGNEIIFNGTAEKFKWIYSKLKLLEDKLQKLKCKNFCSTTSNHMTYVTLQDKLILPIVLKNIYQITRAYQCALYWLTGADPTKSHRGQNYCPNINSRTISDKIDTMKSRGGRAMINLLKQKTINIDNKELLSGLRVEFRETDGMRVPSALTAIMFLHRAIIYKAVDLSLKGVYDVTSAGNWARSKMVTDRIGSNRLTENDKMFVIAKAKELISFIAPQLKSMSPEALEILRNMADKPISAYGTQRPKTIDKALLKRLNSDLTEHEQKIVSIAILGEITETTATKWKKKAMRKLAVSQRMVEYLMKKVEDKTGKRFVFDNEFNNYRLV